MEKKKTVNEHLKDVKKEEFKKDNHQPVFGMEMNVTRAYAYAQINVFGFINASKYTLGELAKKLGIDRKTFTQRFKEQSWKPMEFHNLINLLEKELFTNLQKKEEVIKNLRDE